ncbi:Gmad2 immunoglobulin-like domain-containing protein [Cellulomonas sp. ATA003]|uniref:Gmad2 immunoglobulin-like domain-containing protein n=1 Tax=Cellulomonas sp. ATA003 TaxID=3073064 RepID=UPI0028730423|nr:Gmad2 immunoglobulin-like domain-containing protein [Cellulomonas sp. ATA003]WNB87155.1 Gmad2 immunoglobulin-like domain-containing protein [Cellulomonas sp. ATA003]
MHVHRRGTALAAAAVLALTAACGDGTDGAAPTTPAPVVSSPAATPDPSPTTSPSPTSAPQTSSVYYLVDTRTGFRLAHEPRELAGDDPVRAAVEAMIAGPDDSDYSSPWDPATEVLGVTRDGGTIVVDLSEEARTASVGSEAAALMVQQLVYTATEAAGDPDAGVLLTIGGEQDVDLWGVLVWDEPVMRTDPLSVRLLVQIDTPAEGATTGSPVTVSGDAAVFEATLLWQVLDAQGAEVESGVTTTAEGQTFAPYSFDVDLQPDTYTVVISESDPSDGEGGAVMTDSRTVTVD